MSSKYKYLFGPLISRRFGRSLGVDLCPMKTCSYDCIFCQLGKTNNKTIERQECFPFQSICSEIDQWLKNDGNAEYITLAGSGEPTLYSRLGELIDYIHTKTSIPVLLLSNGSLFWQAQIREEAAKADVVKLSMSPWNERLFNCINRPAPRITFERMLSGEIKFSEEYKGKLILEVFLLDGVNAIEADVRKIAEITNKMTADTIHLNTVTRPASEEFALSVNKEKLELFSEIFTPKAQIPAEVEETPIFNKNIDKERILDLIKRRPISINQLANAFEAHPNEISKITGKLLRDNKIIMERVHGENFFKNVSKQKVALPRGLH